MSVAALDVVEMPEQFDIHFIAMGQGDGCFIRCPDGTTLMFDCGSKSFSSDEEMFNAQLLLRSRSMAGVSRKLDALILSHPDPEHYNRAWELFGPVDWTGSSFDVGDETFENYTDASLGIREIYFSGAGDSSSGKLPLFYYNQNGAAETLQKRLGVEYFHEATFNGTNSLATWSTDDLFASPTTSDETLPDIFSGITDSGTNWAVSIVAANVAQQTSENIELSDEAGNALQDTASADNASSLVLLLKFGDKKALLCGDATFSTERFLIDQYGDDENAFDPNLLKDVDLVQVANHGGASCSSSPDFVNLVNPKQVVVSVGENEQIHQFPKYKALERWLGALTGNGLDDTEAAHNVDYWLSASETADGTETDSASNGMRLFRSSRTSPLQETAMGSIHVSLSDS